jgi:hypothetical protein
MPEDFELAVGRIGVTVGSVVLTWYAHASQKCSPVLASSAVALLSSLVSPGLGQAGFCGSFAGMSAPSLLANGWSDALQLGILTSVLFETLIHYRNLLLGIGGRLGFVAFLALNSFALLHHIPLFTSSTSVLTPPSLLSTTLFTAMGAVITIALREASDDRPASDPVRASALVGILAALLVGCHEQFNNASALAVYAGSFVGMSLPSRLLKGIIPGQSKPISGNNNKQPATAFTLLSIYALAGALGGMYNVLLTRMGLWAVPAGWGGKAGTTSMLGVLTCRLLSKLIPKQKPPQQQP